MPGKVLEQFRLRAATLPRCIGARLGEALLVSLLTQPLDTPLRVGLRCMTQHIT